MAPLVAGDPGVSEQECGPDSRIMGSGWPHLIGPYTFHPGEREHLDKVDSWVSRAQDLGQVVISPGLRAVLSVQ